VMVLSVIPGGSLDEGNPSHSELADNQSTKRE
jgi:hypothetical protein